MKLEFHLALEQKQQLTLTPSLRLSIDILQDTSLELEERIAQELEENPLLERTDLSQGESYNDAIRYYKAESSEQFHFKRDVDIWEHLQFQISTLDLSKEEQALVLRLVEYIEPTGYLNEEYLKDKFFNRYDEETKGKALWTLQQLHPTGVGARDLAECLSIQLRRKGIDTMCAVQIVEHSLEDVANCRIDKIAQTHNLSTAEVERCMKIIRSLDPKPGLKYSSRQEVTTIIPDIFMNRNEKGDMQIHLNERTYPQITINSYYTSLTPDQLDARSRVYISSKTQRARIFLDAIAQRRTTILRVMNSIYDLQRSFFDEGEAALKPMNLIDVAEQLGMHESTISRAVSGKYLLYDNRVMPLSYFFPSAVQGTDGFSVASTVVKQMIESIIEDENPLKPYSDEKISGILRKKGIQIARRTVAKYRDELQILPSGLRRSYSASDD